MSKLIHVCIAAGILVLSGVAAAQPSAADEEAAREHFERGKAHYVLHAYDEAAAEYLLAYDLVKKPLLLYNAAQAYRLAGDLAKAIEYYELYISLVPDGAGSANARALVDELRAEIRQREIAEQAKASDSGVQATLLSEPGEGGRDGGMGGSDRYAGQRWLPWVPWTVAGAGGVVMLSGLIWRSKAGDSFAEYDRMLIDLCPAGCVEGAVDDGVYERGVGQRNMALGSYIAGGAIAAAGLVMVFMNQPRERAADGLSVTPAFAPSGAAVTMDLRF